MRKAIFLISIFAFASIAGTASAAKLCQLDWLNAWQNASGGLSNSRYSYSRGNSDASGNGGTGIWSVISDHGSSGAYHTVSGQSFCSNVNSGAYLNSLSFDTDVTGNNKNCWCRMTSPNLGGSWVFSCALPSSAWCASACPTRCAGCIHDGENSSCRRSAVLALP